MYVISHSSPLTVTIAIPLTIGAVPTNYMYVRISYVGMYIHTYIKTHGSELRGQAK